MDEQPEITEKLGENVHQSASINTSGVPHYKHFPADEPNLSPVSQNAIIQVSEMYMRYALLHKWQLNYGIRKGGVITTNGCTEK